MVEQAGEFGIVALVVDDEAGIDGDAGPVIVDCHGMAVAAGAKLALINGDRIAARQRPCRGITRDPGPHHSDAHSSPLCLSDGSSYGRGHAAVSAMGSVGRNWS